MARALARRTARGRFSILSIVVDEHAQIRKLDHAQNARAILENPLWDEAFTAIDARLVEVFRKGETDGDKLLQASIAIKLLHQVRATLEKHFETGKLAQQELKFLREDEK
jgi:hypothetical protein